jgi:recombinational DNA repair protein (RecF pathway)
MTAVKRCPRCGQVKGATQFYRRRGGRLSPYCQPCTRAASQQARRRRRLDPTEAARLRAIDPIRQRRRRALTGQEGGDR